MTNVIPLKPKPKNTLNFYYVMQKEWLEDGSLWYRLGVTNKKGELQYWKEWTKYEKT